MKANGTRNFKRLVKVLRSTKAQSEKAFSLTTSFRAMEDISFPQEASTSENSVMVFHAAEVSTSSRQAILTSERMVKMVEKAKVHTCGVLARSTMASGRKVSLKGWVHTIGRTVTSGLVHLSTTKCMVRVTTTVQRRGRREK